MRCHRCTLCPALRTWMTQRAYRACVPTVSLSSCLASALSSPVEARLRPPRRDLVTGGCTETDVCVFRRHVRYIDGQPAIISDDYFDERIVRPDLAQLVRIPQGGGGD